MNRTIIIFLLGIFTVQTLSGQLTFTQKRQRDKALNEAITRILQEDYEMASAILTECIDMDSTFAPAYLQRGRILLEWGAFDDALEDLNRAILLDPGLGEAYFYKGYLLYREDTTGTDAVLFDKAIQNGFHDPWAYYFRGLTRLREGRDGMAMNDFSKAIDLEMDFALAYHERAGIKKRMGDLQGALFDYKTALDYRPDFPIAYNNMGSVKILLGDYEGAIQDYTTALEQDPGLYIALNNRGYARYFFGDLDAALQDFDAAITMKSDFPVARLNKSSVLVKQDRIEPALSLLSHTIEEHPDEALLHLNRGLIRELTGDLDGACEDWHRAQELGAEKVDEYLKECNNN